MMKSFASLIPITEQEEEMIAAARRVDFMIQKLLLAVLIISGLFLIAGLIWQAIAGLPPVRHVLWITDWSQANRAEQLLSIGLAVLILSPMLRLIGVGVGLAQQRDWRFVLATALILVIMLAGIWLR
ncbi:MAG: hypothetical protein Kow0047_26860 [Anaerolineae bacterium]